MRHAYPLELAARWDRDLCLRFNRVSRCKWARRLFCGVSRLGDGVFWYALMLALLLGSEDGAVPAVLHMMGVGVLCSVIYKWIKSRTSRPRPYQVHPGIVLSARPLDQFSFPSGHTLHAVAFTTVAIAYFPGLAGILLPFALLVAASRVILGLHYPSDVLVGAAVGVAVAAASLLI